MHALDGEIVLLLESALLLLSSITGLCIAQEGSFQNFIRWIYRNKC